MPQTEVFDLEGALNRLGGDEELFRDVARFFMEDSPGLLDQVRAGLGDGNAELVERSAHSLKGLAANFGAARAVEAALAVERFGRAGDLTAAGQRLPGLEREIKQLQQALEPYYQDSQ